MSLHRVITVTAVDLEDLDEVLGALEDIRDAEYSISWEWKEVEDEDDA